MPIMAATWGVNDAVSSTFAHRLTPAIAMPTPTTAVRIGTPAATTEPKATTRINAAASSPTISLAGIPPSPNQSPESSTWTPASCTGSTRSLMAATDSNVSASERPSAKVTSAWAMRPPGATSRSPTRATPGTVATCCRRASIRPGSRVTSPKTIPPESPLRAGNSRARMSWARCESVPGRLPSVAHLPAKVEPRALMATRTKIQAPTVRHLWRKHERATEESMGTS